MPSISGFVYDPTTKTPQYPKGLPVENASIAIPQIKKIVQTDYRGNFAITVNSGVYIIYVVQRLYEKYTTPKIQVYNDVFIEIPLKSDPRVKKR